MEPLAKRFRVRELDQQREPPATPLRIEPLQPQCHVAESDARRNPRQDYAAKSLCQLPSVSERPCSAAKPGYQRSQSPPANRYATTMPPIATAMPLETATPTATPRSPNLARMNAAAHAITPAIRVSQM